MIIMDALLLDKEFNDYWSMLTPIQKESLLSVVKAFVEPKEKPGHISLEQYNRELEDAEREIENGDIITHEDLLKEIRKW